MKSILLECRDVKKSYVDKKDQIDVLKGINFKVNVGEVCMIYGRSGTGKSTLLSLLGGLDTPTSGSIIFQGCHVEKMANEQLSNLRRKSIGIIFQNFNLIVSWTAFENVQAALFGSELTKVQKKEKVENLLIRLGLKERLNVLPAKLSVGQQQRVAIARTIINSPLLILADEPTGDVDPETADEITAVLYEQVKKNNSTIIIASHGNFKDQRIDSKYNLRNGVLQH